MSSKITQKREFMINNQMIEVLRDELGLSKKDFSSELSITQNAYTNYSKGKRAIPTDLLLKIQDMYSININWLLTGKGEMYLKKTASQNIIGDHNITAGGAINGNISINTSKFNHKDDVAEIIELLEYAPSGFLTIIKEKLLAFKKMSEF